MDETALRMKTHIKTLDRLHAKNPPELSLSARISGILLPQDLATLCSLARPLESDWTLVPDQEKSREITPIKKEPESLLAKGRRLFTGKFF